VTCDTRCSALLARVVDGPFARLRPEGRQAASRTRLNFLRVYCEALHGHALPSASSASSTNDSFSRCGCASRDETTILIAWSCVAPAGTQKRRSEANSRDASISVPTAPRHTPCSPLTTALSGSDRKPLHTRK